MSPAPVATYLQALLVSVANNTCVGLADAVEGISHDALNRLLQGSTPLLAMLQRLVIKLVQKGGYLILDDTTLQKFTTGLGCIFKVKDHKTGGFILDTGGAAAVDQWHPQPAGRFSPLSRPGEAQQT